MNKDDYLDKKIPDEVLQQSEESPEPSNTLHLGSNKPPLNRREVEKLIRVLERQLKL